MGKMNYQEFSKEELISRIKQLEKKKFGLIWEDKSEDVADVCRDTLPILGEVPALEVSSSAKLTDPMNILIEGDNYHALYVLNFTHKKQIDFIYIDPPYNTGAKDWKYNNSYVDSSDPYRHSKWLSFMEKRLRLSKNLLKDDGIICVTIDDYEMPRLWLLMDSIFGESNHLGTVIIRNNPKGRKTERKASLIHEYALFYGRTDSAKLKKKAIEIEDKSHKYKKDEFGNWSLDVNLRKQGVDSNAYNRKGKLSERYYPIYVNIETGQVSTKHKYDLKILPIDPKGEKRIWRRSKSVIDEMYSRGEIFYNKTPYGHQIYYKFVGGLDGEPYESIWTDSIFSASEYGTKELDTILGKRESFPYPKSPYAVMECINAAVSNPNAVILDFFAGSGTTAQAVLELNETNKSNMQFILSTNNENNICEEVCYPRIKQVIEGYKNSNPLPANLKYYRTDFIPQVITDQHKRDLVVKSTEMLCLAENTFNLVTDAFPRYRTYEMAYKATLIIYDEDYILESINRLAEIPLTKKIVIYVFSYDHEYNDEDFQGIHHDFMVKPIPEVILNVYRKIAKGRKH